MEPLSDRGCSNRVKRVKSMGKKASRAGREEAGSPVAEPVKADATAIDAVSEALRGTIEGLRDQRLAAMEAAIDGMALTDGRGTFTYMNAAHARMHGYDDPEELIGTSWRTLVPPLEADRHAEVAHSVLCETGHWEGERLGLRRDGTTFDVGLSLTKLESGDIVLICRDLSERKQADQVRLDAREVFRQLAEHIHEVFWLTDLEDNRVVYVSPMYETVWGRSAEELYESPRDWVDAIHPDDRPRVTESWERDAVHGRFDEIYRVRRPDGAVRWIHDRGFPIRNEAGEVYRLAGLAEDITERKRVEEALRFSGEQLRSITESSPDYIMMLDTQARIVFINRAFPDLTPGQLIGSAVYDWVDVRFRGPMRECFERVLSTGRPDHYVVEYDLDGTTLTFESRVGPIMRDGEVFALAVNSREVTDRLEMESSVQSSQERLERLADRLHAVREEERAFISREIHDQLGQTLTGLRLDVAWMKDRLPPDDDELEERAGHALRLIADALDGVRDLSKRLRPASLDDLGLEAAAEAYLRDIGEMTGLDWSVDGQIDGYELQPRCATAAYRILQEAATNITRHAKASRAHVRLWVENGDLRMHIHDDGLGITDPQIESRESVGLTGMNERARACGGLVIIERPDDGGTAVNVTIPLESPGA